jgi:hypothetical protein
MTIEEYVLLLEARIAVLEANAAARESVPQITEFQWYPPISVTHVTPPPA